MAAGMVGVAALQGARILAVPARSTIIRVIGVIDDVKRVGLLAHFLFSAIVFVAS
jgi:hypothetical protein